MRRNEHRAPARSDVPPTLPALQDPAHAADRRSMPFDVGEALRAVGDIAFVWLPIVMFALIIYLLWRSLSLMPRVKTTHVKPTSRSAVTWDQVAGLDEAKGELREVVEFLRHPKKFSRLGARVPKGILLYGPPG